MNYTDFTKHRLSFQNQTDSILHIINGAMIESNVSLSCAWCAGGGDGTRAHLDENHSEHSLSPTGHLVVAVCLGFIGTFGFLNNTLVLILFCRYKVLRSPMNYLLVSISVSDLLVCVLGTPFSFAASTQGRWLIGRAGCVWYGFINSFLGESVCHSDIFDERLK